MQEETRAAQPKPRKGEARAISLEKPRRTVPTPPVESAVLPPNFPRSGGGVRVRPNAERDSGNEAPFPPKKTPFVPKLTLAKNFNFKFRKENSPLIKKTREPSFNFVRKRSFGAFVSGASARQTASFGAKKPLKKAHLNCPPFKNIFMRNSKFAFWRIQRTKRQCERSDCVRDIRLPIHAFANYGSSVLSGPRRRRPAREKPRNQAFCVAEGPFGPSSKEEIRGKVRRYFSFDPEKNVLTKNVLKKSFQDNSNLLNFELKVILKNLKSQNQNIFRKIPSVQKNLGECGGAFEALVAAPPAQSARPSEGHPAEAPGPNRTCGGEPSEAFDFKILEKVFFLLNKLLTSDPIAPRDLQMPLGQKKLVIAFLNKKNPDFGLTLETFTRERLRLFRLCEKEKRKEERLKYTFKKAVNHLQAQFRRTLSKRSLLSAEAARGGSAALDYLFYGHFFGCISRDLGVPLEKFFHFRNWKTRANSHIPKSITKAYIRLISQNSAFVRKLFHYVQHRLLRDALLINCNKVASLVAKWELFLLKDASEGAYAALEEQIRRKTFKFPWGVVEIKKAISDTLRFFRKAVNS